MTDFDTFWAAYPAKVGKGAARKAFAKAIKLTDLETMLAALAVYKQRKPDWQNFAHPSTWLHQERWEDEWPEPKALTGGGPRSFEHNVVSITTKYRPAFLEQWEKQKAGNDE